MIWFKIQADDEGRASLSTVLDGPLSRLSRDGCQLYPWVEAPTNRYGSHTTVQPLRPRIHLSNRQFVSHDTEKYQKTYPVCIEPTSSTSPRSQVSMAGGGSVRQNIPQKYCETSRLTYTRGFILAGVLHPLVSKMLWITVAHHIEACAVSLHQMTCVVKWNSLLQWRWHMCGVCAFRLGII